MGYDHRARRKNEMFRDAEILTVRCPSTFKIEYSRSRVWPPVMPENGQFTFSTGFGGFDSC